MAILRWHGYRLVAGTIDWPDKQRQGVQRHDQMENCLTTRQIAR